MNISFGTVVNVRNNLYCLKQSTIERLYMKYGRCLCNSDIRKLRDEQEDIFDSWGVQIQQDDLQLVSYSENPAVITEKNFIFGYFGFALTQWNLANITIVKEESNKTRYIKEVGKDWDEFSFRGDYYITDTSFKRFKIVDGFYKVT